MLRALCGSSDERQVDLCGCGCGKLLLCLLGSFLQSLQCHLILRQIHILCLLELIYHPLGNAVVVVITAEVRITVGSQNLDNAVTDLDNRYIEGTAAQVINHDLLLGLIIQTISQRCGCRLVDDTLYLEAGNASCVLGGLSLGIVEVCRNSDDSLTDLLTEICLGICLQLLQDHCGNLLRCVALAVDAYLVVRAHVSLDGSDGSVCIGYGLTLCGLADQSLAVLCECHNGRCGSETLCIGDDGGLTTLHNGYAAIGCT